MKNFFLVLLGMIGVVAAGGGTYFYLIDVRLHRVLFEVDGDLQTMSLKEREDVLDAFAKRINKIETDIPDGPEMKSPDPVKPDRTGNGKPDAGKDKPPKNVADKETLPPPVEDKPGPSKSAKELDALAGKAMEQFKTAETAWEKNRNDVAGLKVTLAMLKDFLVRAKKERKALKPDEWQAVSERTAGLKAEIFSKHFASGLSTFNLAISKDASLKKLRDECRDLFNDVMNENK